MATTGRAEATSPPVQTARRSVSEFDPSFLYAGMWIVFLAVPVIGIFYEGAALGWQILGMVSVALFGVVYLWLSWRGFAAAGDSREPTTGELIAGVALLAALGALAIPSAGPWVSSFTPFMAALVVYTRRMEVGIPAGILIWAVPSMSAFILAEDKSLWILGGPGLAMMFVIVIRITEHFEENSRRRADELRAAEERDHIARDVHDVLGHSLTVLTVKAQLARRLMDSAPDQARSELEEIERLSRESLTQVRSTVTRLKVPQLPGELDVAASTFESAGIEVSIDSALSGEAPAVLAWALREAVTNVVRHADATRCEVRVSEKALMVADDGRGLGDSAEGNGLRGLRERARTSAAEVLIGRAYPELEGTTPERPGTQIQVRIP